MGDCCSMKLENWSVNKKESLVVSTFCFKDATWMSTSSLCGKAYRITNAKTKRLLRLGALCGKMGDDPIATWKSKIKWYSEKTITSRIWIELAGMPTGVPVESIPRNHDVGPTREDSKSNERPHSVNLSHSQTGSSSCQCTTTYERWAEGKQRKMWIQFTDSCELCSQIPSRSLVFLGGLDQKRSGAELTETELTDHGINQQENVMANFSGPVIQYFVPPEPLREDHYEAKQEARSRYTSMVVTKTSSCFSAQWFLRISSSINGSRFMQRITRRSLGSRETLQHLIIWRRWTILPTPLLQNILPVHRNGETRGNSNTCQKTRNNPNCVPMRFEVLYSWTRSTTDATFMPRMCDASQWERTRGRGWVHKNTRIGPVLHKKVRYHDVIDTVSKFKYHLCFKTIPFLVSESWMTLTSTWRNRCCPRKKRTQLRWNPLLKQDQDRSPKQRWRPFLFLFLKGNGSTLKHTITRS